jgi:hypothetical protein
MSGKGAKGLSGKGAKGTMGDKKGDKKKPTSRSARAGLQFPVGRIHRLLKVRVAPGAPARPCCWAPGLDQHAHNPFQRLTTPCRPCPARRLA